MDHLEVNPEHNDSLRELLREMEEHSMGEAGHAERVAVFAVATGERLGLNFEELIRLRQAASLHDVGKIQVDKTFIRKLGDLEVEDFVQIRLHAQRTKKLVESLTWLTPALPMIVHHHERWDGTGYPDSLFGTEIPLGARIIAVAETFDNLTNGTGLREAVSEEEAIEEIKRLSGRNFDPAVVRAFIQIQPLVQPIG